jgi:hypothetical protein
VSEAFEETEEIEFEIEQGNEDEITNDGFAGKRENEQQESDATDDCFKIEFRNVIFKNLNYKI